ncbi:hypothetical protein O6P43_021425 [Quillaja saponaria]|uniref:Uncharacterized protein n=1 Tax=Quillaja saponaria TaxID=32244 RepID=A0AAD7PH58_QUISA|nr:hypothetical protein O6P43_021425 [Quillaja saponaria]
MSLKYLLVLLFGAVVLLATSTTTLADDHPKPPIIGKLKPPHRPSHKPPPYHKPPSDHEEEQDVPVYGELPTKKGPIKPPPKHLPPPLERRRSRPMITSGSNKMYQFMVNSQSFHSRSILLRRSPHQPTELRAKLSYCINK